MTSLTQDTPTTRWPIAAQFLDALVRRDFPALAACLSPDVRMRAVTPFRELDLHGPDEVTARFAMWFGDKTEFNVIDASIGGIGRRASLQWRLRTKDDTGPVEIVEQHVFASAGERIESLDLICSGFQPEVGDI